ncbi:hypothetical protein Tco_0905424, partial [Tanacetum coccineum]
MAVNTKFLNLLQPEWNKYVTNVRLAKNLVDDTYDASFNHLQQYERIFNASRAKLDYDDYQGDTIYDDQEYNLTTAMMLLAREITQRYSTPTNNYLRNSSNTMNQAIVQGESADNGNGQYARDCPKLRVRDSKYFLEQMLLAKKDEAIIILTNEQNDFLLTDAFEIEELEDFSANICMMARIQQAGNDYDDGPIYDSTFINEVQNPPTSFMNPLYSQSDHEQTYHEQHEMINLTIGNDQINSDIIFDDPNVEVNHGKVAHDKNAHDQQDNALELLARNAYIEAEKQQMIAKEVNQRNVELTKELEKYKAK